jgi:ribonucleoside-diphosphate reductase beta chain
MQNNIFNTEKTLEQYSNPKIYLNDAKGLINTIHKSFPKIWSLYKEIKALDWSEDEFDYSQCLQDFKTVDKDVSDFMINTLAWQWEADSIAATSPIVLIAPFNPSIEIWETEAAITVNELVHANTYSEIVRMSFDKPEEVLDEILKKQESLKRLESVTTFLSEFENFSKEVQYGTEYSEEETIKYLLKYYFAMLLLERIQFMASFAITFTIAKTGLFQAIGQAVKKIAQDELEVHVEYRKQVILELQKMDKTGKIWESIKPELNKMFHDVVTTEMIWTEELFKDKNLVGVNADLIKEWVLFNAKDVAKFAKLESQFQFPTKNPIPFLEDWFNMNAAQQAPQEIQVAAYKVNATKRNDENITFNDF